MADSNEQLAAVARQHAMAVKVIAEWLAIWPVTRSLGPETNDKVARSILARLASNDPPLLLCTPNEVYPESLRPILQNLIALIDAIFDPRLKWAWVISSNNAAIAFHNLQEATRQVKEIIK